MPLTVTDTARATETPGALSPFVRRHAWLGVLAVGTALFVGVERTTVATQNPNLVPSTILPGAADAPMAFRTFVYGRWLPYRVSAPVAASAAFFGGLIGLIVATLEYDAQRDLGALPMVGVGLIKETSTPLPNLAGNTDTGWESPLDHLRATVTDPVVTRPGPGYPEEAGCRSPWRWWSRGSSGCGRFGQSP